MADARPERILDLKLHFTEEDASEIEAVILSFLTTFNFGYEVV